MNDFIFALTGSLGVGALWSIVGIAVPFLAISVLFNLGIWLIKHILYSIHYAGFEREYGYRPSVYHKGRRIY